MLGVVLAKLGDKGRPLLDLFICLSDSMMMLTSWVIFLAPVGVFFLIIGQILELETLDVMAEQLGWYVITVALGLVIHGLVFLPTLFGICTKSLPFKFIGNMNFALATAFSTASSSATLPVTIKCLEENNKVDPRVSR